MSKITEAKRAAETALRTLTEVMATFERFGDEPGVGEVIRFTKRFIGGSKTYSYAALRTERGWFTTSRSATTASLPVGRNGSTAWEDLIEFIGDGKAWISSSWTEVPSLNPEIPADDAALLEKVTNALTEGAGKTPEDLARHLLSLTRENTQDWRTAQDF